MFGFIFKNNKKKNNGRNRLQDFRKEIVKRNKDVVEKGIEIYNELIKLLENNEFKNFVSSSFPHFIIRGRYIMIASPISASSELLHYYEEVYNNMREKENVLCNYSIENICDCEELCCWHINEYSIKDYSCEYAIVRIIGVLSKNDDDDYVSDGNAVVEEILKRIVIS